MKDRTVVQIAFLLIMASGAGRSLAQPAGSVRLLAIDATAVSECEGSRGPLNSSYSTTSGQPRLFDNHDIATLYQCNWFDYSNSYSIERRICVINGSLITDSPCVGTPSTEGWPTIQSWNSVLGHRKADCLGAAIEGFAHTTIQVRFEVLRPLRGVRFGYSLAIGQYGSRQTSSTVTATLAGPGGVLGSVSATPQQRQIYSSSNASDLVLPSGVYTLSLVGEGSFVNPPGAKASWQAGHDDCRVSLFGGTDATRTYFLGIGLQEPETGIQGARDVELLRHTLSSRLAPDNPPPVVLDPTADNLNRIESAIANLGQRLMPGDRVIVFVSTHGVFDQSGVEPLVISEGPIPQPPGSLQDFIIGPVENRGKEFIQIGRASDQSTQFLDESVFRQFFAGNPRFRGVDMTFVLDQCYAEGFGDALRNLPAKVVSGSPESQVSYSNRYGDLINGPSLPSTVPSSEYEGGVLTMSIAKAIQGVPPTSALNWNDLVTSAQQHCAAMMPGDARTFCRLRTKPDGFDYLYQQTYAAPLPTFILQPPAPQTCPGDLNLDGAVDDIDFSIFSPQYDTLRCVDDAMPSSCASDLTRDGMVDDADFLIFVSAYEAVLCP